MRPGPIAGMLACSAWLALQLAGWTPAPPPRPAAAAAHRPGPAQPTTFACDAPTHAPAATRLAVACAYADGRPGRCTVSTTPAREPRSAPARCAPPPAAG